MKTLLLILLTCIKVTGIFCQEDTKALYDSIVALKERREYEKAIILAEKMLEVMKKKIGDTTVVYASDVIHLAEIYELAQKLDKAEERFLQAYDIIAKATGKKGGRYQALVEQIGNFFVKTKQYAKAEPFFIESLKIWEALSEDLSTNALERLADLHYTMQLYDKAEQEYLRMLIILQRLANNTPRQSYIDGLWKVAAFYQAVGNIAKAEAMFSKAVDAYKGSQMPAQYATALNYLGVFYAGQRVYHKAAPVLEKAIQIRRERNERNVRLVDAITNLAQVYEKMNDHEKAEPLYLEAFEMTKLLFKENTEVYANQLRMLGKFYDLTHKYDLSESHLLKAEAIYKQLGPLKPSYAFVLADLGSLYLSLLQYPKAEQYYLNAVQVLERNEGVEEDQVNAQNNLGLVYLAAGDLEKAIKLLLKTSESIKQRHGEHHVAYAEALKKLGLWYMQTGIHDEAEKRLHRSVLLLTQLSGETDPSTLEAKAALGTLYFLLKQYSKAEPVLKALHAFYSSQNGRDPHAEAVMLNLAMLYYYMDQPTKAETFLLPAIQAIRKRIASDFDILSENEKNTYLLKEYSRIETLSSVLYTHPATANTISKELFNLILFVRSLSLNSTAEVFSKVRNSKDTAVQKMYAEWKAGKSFLASTGIAKDASSIDSVEAKIEALEKQLTRHSSVFANYRSFATITIKDVQQRLEAGEAAIEFVRFKLDRLNTPSVNDSIMYMAYVLRKEDTMPQVVHLFEEASLQKLFDASGSDASARATTLYRAGIKSPRSNIPRSDSLYKLVWQPLEPYLKGISKIAYAPTGKLYAIAFNAMSAGHNSALMDKYRLRQYTSIRQVAMRSNTTQKPSNAVLFGDAAFTMDSSQVVKRNGNAVVPVALRDVPAITWQQLPGTALEVNKLRQLFTSNSIKTSAFMQHHATEEALKLLDGKAPSILHIATHGFFLPGTEQKVNPVLNPTYQARAWENPLLRSGIVLSGANHSWNKKEPVKGFEDGICTAFEISQLDLSNVELVVLSACETALGDLKGTEGVFGLQRAFKLAGVKKMILSLWQVPDKETAELMIAFYTQVIKGRTIEGAFTMAQSAMKAKYSPYHWAAFTLVE